jgi:hypothetical protein
VLICTEEDTIPSGRLSNVFQSAAPALFAAYEAVKEYEEEFAYEDEIIPNILAPEPLNPEADIVNPVSTIFPLTDNVPEMVILDCPVNEVAVDATDAKLVETAYEAVGGVNVMDVAADALVALILVFAEVANDALVAELAVNAEEALIEVLEFVANDADPTKLPVNEPLNDPVLI